MILFSPSYINEAIINNIDGRSLSDSIREEIRFKAIKGWNGGMSPTNLAHKYGTSRKIVYQWIYRYNQGGWDVTGHLKTSTKINFRCS